MWAEGEDGLKRVEAGPAAQPHRPFVALAERLQRLAEPGKKGLDPDSGQVPVQRSREGDPIAEKRRANGRDGLVERRDALLGGLVDGLAQILSYERQTDHAQQLILGETQRPAADGGQQELAIASRDGPVRVVDATPTRPEVSRASLGARVWAAAINPSATLVVVRRDEDPVVEIRDVGTGALIATVAHDDEVWDIAFSPNGETLATRGKDQSTRLWDPTTGAEVLRVDHPERTNGMARFSTSSTRLLFRRWTTSEWQEDHLEVRDTKSGDVIGKPINGYINSFEFTPDSRYLAIGSGNYAPTREPPYSKPMGFFGLRMLDIEAGREVLRQPHEEVVRNVRFSPNGAWLAATSSWKVLLLYDRRDGYRAAELARLRGQDRFDQIVFGPDSRSLAARSTVDLAFHCDHSIGTCAELKVDAAVRETWP